MSSRAQRRANRSNSKLSTGPKTEKGKLASSRNNVRHGLAGRLIIATLSAQDAAEFESLASELRLDHQPSSITENLLVDRMAESYYLSSKAIGLQAAALASGDDSRLGLLLRYQTTHERTFSKCLNDLAKLRKEKRLEQIGFESQKQKQEADEAEKKADEKRKALRKMEREFHAYVNAPMPRYDWPLPGDPEEAEDEEDGEEEEVSKGESERLERQSEEVDRMIARRMAEKKAKQNVETQAPIQDDAA